MERAQDVPSDVVIEVGMHRFPLHKFMLVSKSGLLRRKITTNSTTSRVTLPEDMPGGPETFEKVVRFCYGIDFEITVHNVVALRCAAEYLEMIESYSRGNLVGRTEEFLKKAALNSLVTAVLVLRSCESFLPLAEDLKIVEKCVDAVALKALNESNFPIHSPPEWWAFELAPISLAFLGKVIASMRLHGAASRTLVVAITAYAQKTLLSNSSSSSSSSSITDQKSLLESLTSILPSDTTFPIGFLCCLLRAAIFLDASAASKTELENRISALLDQASVGDLLTVALDFDGERIVDLESLKRIVAGFVEKEGKGGSLYGGEITNSSTGLQNLARIVDAFVAEIATDEDLSVSRFSGIAGALPKSARRFDDDVYRAVDIFLKAHPRLDELEREKVCGVMDPLKLSYEARLHASQNKRLPLQIVLQTLYYDQLNLHASSVAGSRTPSIVVDDASMIRARVLIDSSSSSPLVSSLVEENEALKSELIRMKMCISDLQSSERHPVGSSYNKLSLKKPMFLIISMSKKIGRLNPFHFTKQGSKDASNIHDGEVQVAKPRRKRRFSIS